MCRTLRIDGHCNAPRSGLQLSFNQHRAASKRDFGDHPSPTIGHTLLPENISDGATIAVTHEVDQILLAEIQRGRNKPNASPRTVRQIVPSVSSDAIHARMQQIAAHHIPKWLRGDESWTR
jgi:hypothetical protein